MKKIIYLLILLASISFVACNDDDDTDTAWAEANQKAYDEVVADKSWVLLYDYINATGPNGVYYKKIKEGEGTEYPIETSQVEVYYKGYFYDGTVFDPGTSLNGIPVSFQVNGVVRGFGYALQNMVVGDKWEVCIPYYLGYGVTDYLSIKAYSTLFFEIELVEINQYP